MRLAPSRASLFFGFIVMGFASAGPTWPAGMKTTGADFLQIDPSAHAAAMGGGFGSLAEDVHALYYNPAGLALVGRAQFTASHMEWIAGMQNEYVAFASSAGSIGWGASLFYLHAEETERDALGRHLSTFAVGDGVISTGMGVRLTDRHHLGVSGKYIERHLYHRSARGFAADLGYQYRLQTESGTFWKLGALIKNLGPKMGFAVKEKLPTGMEASASYEPMLWLRRPVTVTAALVQSVNEGGIAGRLGVEGTLLSRFHIRLGYLASGARDERLRAGFGVELFDLGKIDFAAVRIGRFNSSLLMTLTLQMAPPKK